jgi:Gluconate 2-dehydrogenase subunit 3
MGNGQKKAGGTLKRRDMLKAITALPAAALVSLEPASGSGLKDKAATSAVQPIAGAYQFKTFTDHEGKTVRVLSDLIIPADERSGSATQAGVPEFIDDWLDFKRGELLDQIRGGLTWLDLECNRLFDHDFADCSPTERKQILDRIAYPKSSAPEDANAVAFFNHLRDLVASGFFSSKMGVEDLPYLGNKMVADWEGCPADVRTEIERNLLKQGVELKLDDTEGKG